MFVGERSLERAFGDRHRWGRIRIPGRRPSHGVCNHPQYASGGSGICARGQCRVRWFVKCCSRSGRTRSRSGDPSGRRGLHLQSKPGAIRWRVFRRNDPYCTIGQERKVLWRAGDSRADPNRPRASTAKCEAVSCNTQPILNRSHIPEQTGTCWRTFSP
jgi:hypothetical protein